MPKEDLLKEFEEITKIAEKPKPAPKEGKKAEVKEEIKKEEKKHEEKPKPAKEKKKEEEKPAKEGEKEEKREEKVEEEIEEEEEEEKEKSLKYIGCLLLILGIIIYIYAFYARIVLHMRILYWSGWIALAGAGLFAIGGGLVSKYRRR